MQRLLGWPVRERRWGGKDRSYGRVFVMANMVYGCGGSDLASPLIAACLMQQIRWPTSLCMSLFRLFLTPPPLLLLVPVPISRNSRPEETP